MCEPGYVFEVQTSQSDGSGILLAAKILSDKFNISVGAAGLDNFINIRTGSIDAIFNLLKTDSRFTVVSAPRLRVKNNASASFSVGSDVPVLGSVTVNNNTTTQSVEYRSSGVLFNVTPSIKSRTMDLKIQQQLSNFVTTETGVNNSPTLIKRDVTTEVSSQLTASVNDSRQILPSLPLVRIMYIMLNAMSYSITSSLIAASSHINTMTVIPFMHVNAAL